MPIEFTCPHCGSQTNVDERFAGQTGACRTCGASVTIPGAAFADGSVHFLSDSVSALRALMTKAGGEPVALPAQP